MRLWVPGWVVLAACGKVAPVADAPAAIDGPGEDASLGAWSTPMRIPELNSPMLDQDPTMTADGLEVIFSSHALVRDARAVTSSSRRAHCVTRLTAPRDARHRSV